MTFSVIPAAPGTDAVVRDINGREDRIVVIAWVVQPIDDDGLGEAYVLPVGPGGVIRNVKRFVFASA